MQKPSMPNMPEPTVTRPAQGRRIGVVGDALRFLVTGAETGGQYAMFESTLEPGSGPPPHRHSREHEAFFILEGEVTFHSGDDQFVAPAGAFVNLPPGGVHYFRNNTKSMARMLITVSPAGLEQMFLAVGTPLSPGQSAPRPTPEDIQKLLAIAPKYGLEILVPAH
jgi:quercetin dioxygenase-like cupin family protein